MNKVRKTITQLSVFVLLLFNFLPVTALSEQQESSDSAVESSSQLMDEDPLQKLTSSEGSTEGSTEDSTETTESTKNQESEDSATEDKTESTTSSSSEEEPSVAAKKQARTNVTSIMEITEWNLLKNNIPVSETVHAVTGESYELKFTWEVKNSTLSPGDYVTFRMPFNQGPTGNGDGASGSWRTSGSSQAVPLTIEVEGQAVKFAEWFIEAYDGGIDYEQIRIQFTDGIRLLEGTNIGTEISTGFDSIKNYTYKGGIQQVEFGGVQKPIDFSQDQLEKSTGWNYKNAMGASVNQIQYDIPVNLPASVELGGDVFDYKVNDDGWAFNPANPAYDWGEHVTDMKDIYVEDTLDEGVTINGLLIIASARAPMQLPSNALTDYRGGMVAALSSFNSYVLADFGNGPVYRTANDPISERQLPKQEYSFKRLYQSSTDTKASFRSKVKSQPYQYGIFLDEATNKQSLMVFFGDVKQDGSMPKYSDLTDQRYTDSNKEVAGSKSDKVFSFAEQAASQLIRNGHYTEADRDQLEAYFTLVYGDSNVLGGQIATFEISLNAQYPPDTKSEEKTNTAQHSFTGPGAPDFPILDEVTAKYKLTNPYSNVQLSSNEAMLFKFTDKNLPLNGAKFELQKKIGEEDGNILWENVENSEVTTNTVTVNVLEGEQIVERQLDGGAKVSNLPDGTYRFVEVESPDGYDPALSPNYDKETKKVYSDLFTVPSSGKSSIVYVTNVAQPKYTVQHYVQTGADALSESNFELRLQENFNGNTGDEVEAVGKSFAGYRLDEGVSYTVKTGNVSADGSLVLKLYYVKDETNRPFYFYKYDESNNPMPSVDYKGDPLGEGKEVTFDIYKYNNAGWNPEYKGKYEPTKVVPTSDTELPNNEGKVWEKVETQKTDANGKISSSNLSLSEDDGALITYGVVETKTYDGYKLPENNQYWVFWTDNEVGGNSVAPFIKGINAENDAPRIGVINDSVPQNEKEYYLTNNYDNWSLYKEDVAENSMPSVNKNGDPLGDDKKVEFDWYEYVGNWDPDPKPEEVAPGESSAWKKRGTLTTDANGKLVGDSIPKEKDKTFALVETSTYKGYHLPTPSQAYWILWDSGWIANKGTNNPGSRTIDAHIHVLKNDYETRLEIYKTDDQTQLPLKKTDKAQVGFRYYRFQYAADDLGPENFPDITDETKWIPLKNPKDGSYIFYADEQGRLTGLEETIIGAHPYAIQEVEAYPGYYLEEGFWYFYMNEIESQNYYGITYMDYHGDSQPHPLIRPDDSNNKLNAYQLTNKQLPYPDLEFTKVNDNNAALANVDFKLYKAKGDVEFNDETEKDGSYWDLDTPYREVTSSLSGKVSFEKLPNGTYLLRETKTAAGYQLPDGDWVITVDSTAEKKITIRARKDTSPPAFKVENDKYYLPNYRVHSLPFTGKWGRVLLLVIGVLLIGLAGMAIVKKPLKSKI